MQTTTALELARDLMRQHGLTGYRAVIDTRPKNRLGQTRYRNREIGISLYHVQNHTDSEIRDTILHEIAHALVGPGYGHGPVWKAKARALGINPRAAAKISAPLTVETARAQGLPLPYYYEAVCPGNGKAHTVAKYSRRPQPRTVRSAICVTHRIRPTWTDIRTGEILGSALAIAPVFVPSRVPAFAAKPWNSGSSSWDEMWGDV